MAMPIQTWPEQGEWTVEQMWALAPDDGNRYEVIDGVLYVTPSPSNPHQDAVGQLYVTIQAYLGRWPKVGWVRMAPADVRFGLKRGVQPDLYVAPLVDGHRPRTWQEITRLMLVAEVLSPGTARRDRGVKRRLYQQVADEYWVVDIRARVVERWKPRDRRAERLDTELRWHPAGAVEPLTLDLPAYFREVWDE